MQHTLDLTVSRIIHAPAQDIFDAWLDPTNVGGVWFDADRVISNPVAGGLFYRAYRDRGQPASSFGRFIRLERGRVIEHTLMSNATGGYESIVSVTFAPREGDTEVFVHHADLPYDEAGRGYQRLWLRHLESLASRLEIDPVATTSACADPTRGERRAPAQRGEN